MALGLRTAGAASVAGWVDTYIAGIPGRHVRSAPDLCVGSDVGNHSANYCVEVSAHTAGIGVPCSVVWDRRRERLGTRARTVCLEIQYLPLSLMHSNVLSQKHGTKFYFMI